MDSITAKEWREMSTPAIISSMDVAMEVLMKRKIDEDWMDLLLDIAKRIIEKAIEKEPDSDVNFAKAWKASH
jgi:hypothetical protein